MSKNDTVLAGGAGAAAIYPLIPSRPIQEVFSSAVSIGKARMRLPVAA